MMSCQVENNEVNEKLLKQWVELLGARKNNNLVEIDDIKGDGSGKKTLLPPHCALAPAYCRLAWEPIRQTDLSYTHTQESPLDANDRQ